jgi:MinD superfamily P-loop ATPase
MKEIVVVSGKGGTGKTSFTAAFAHLAKGPIALGDCDVDAANLALLMHGEDFVEEPFLAGKRARVDENRCTGCGECENACRYEAIPVIDNLAMVNDLLCEGCRACSVVCPEDCITFMNNRAGTLFHRETLTGPMVHGALGIAQDNSGKLVAKVRADTKLIAMERNIDLAIFDGPPGIGCPVHASMGGVDLVVAVTEPSSSGAHDLKRMLDLCDHFKLESAVVVNKYDLSVAVTEEIEEMVLNRGAHLVGRVPFDEGVPRALARREIPLVIPAVKTALENTWGEIVQLLDQPV